MQAVLRSWALSSCLQEGRGALLDSMLPPLHLLICLETLQGACLQNAEEQQPPEQFEHLGLREAPQGNALTTTTRFLKRSLQHDVHAAVQQDSRLRIMHESAELFNQDTERCFQKLSVRLPALLACWAICQVWVVRSGMLAAPAGRPISPLRDVGQVDGRLAKFQRCPIPQTCFCLCKSLGKTDCHISVMAPA